MYLFGIFFNFSHCLKMFIHLMHVHSHIKYVSGFIHPMFYSCRSCCCTKSDNATCVLLTTGGAISALTLCPVYRKAKYLSRERVNSVSPWQTGNKDDFHWSTPGHGNPPYLGRFLALHIQRAKDFPHSYLVYVVNRNLSTQRDRA